MTKHILAGLLALLLLSGSLLAQPAPGSVSGVVTLTTGLPAVGAEVLLAGVNGGHHHHVFFADLHRSAGPFQF